MYVFQSSKLGKISFQTTFHNLADVNKLIDCPQKPTKFVQDMKHDAFYRKLLE